MAQVTLKPDWLKAQLRERGVSQGELGTLANVSANTLAKINKGLPVRASVALRLAQALKALPADLKDALGEEVA